MAISLRVEKGVGHGAADDEAVHPLDQVGEERELGRDLGAADDSDDRPLRRLPTPCSSASSSACISRPAALGRRSATAVVDA